jgi:GNAT superfamily N-acetyltransferase
MDFQTLSLPNGLHIRPSTDYDYSFLSQLYQSTRDDLDLINAEKDFIDHLKETQFQAQTQSYAETYPNALTFIIEYHHEKVGRIILDFGSVEILIVDISLLEKARGKGLGSGVIKSFTHCADQVKVPLKLSVLSNNLIAKRLYTNLGFVLADEVPPRDYMVYYPSTQNIRVGT